MGERLGVLALLCLAPFAWAKDWRYTLRSGDSLWTLCQRFTQQPQRCWADLSLHNGLHQPDLIQPGDTIRLPREWLHHEPVSARVVMLRGEVMLYPADGGGARPLGADRTLEFGDAIETGQGSARVRFADQSEVLVKPASLLVVTRYARFLDQDEATELRLQRGAVRNRVERQQGAGQSRYQVYTPGGTIAVQSGEGDVRVNGEEATRAEVISGRVRVRAAGEEADLDAGRAAIISSDQAALKPVPMLPAPALQVHGDAQGLSAVWAAQGEARGYWLELYSRPGRALLHQEWVEGERWRRLLPPGAYRLSVRAVDDVGLRGGEAWAGARVPLQEPAPPPAPEPNMNNEIVSGASPPVAQAAKESHKTRPGC